MDDMPVFRSQKRRKLVTKPDDDSGTVDEEAEIDELHSVIRAKRQPPSKSSGIRFSKTANRAGLDEHEVSNESGGLSVRATASTGGLSTRFTGSTSSTSIKDRNDNGSTDRTITNEHSLIHSAGDGVSTPKWDNRDQSENYDSVEVAPEKAAERLSKISEVEIPTTIRQDPNDAKVHKQRRRKPRLGRDGKPLKPRQRPGPEPEMLERSALIDEVFHEHNLGTYGTSQIVSRSHGSVSQGKGINEAADDRVAAHFQQEFLDVAAERQERQRRQQKQSESSVAGQGPRLGGSRSARAKMQNANGIGESKEK